MFDDTAKHKSSTAMRYLRKLVLERKRLFFQYRNAGARCNFAHYIWQACTAAAAHSALRKFKIDAYFFEYVKRHSGESARWARRPPCAVR